MPTIIPEMARPSFLPCWGTAGAGGVSIMGE